MRELAALLDGELALTTLREAFGLHDDTLWRVPCYAFVARVAGATVLVDAGLGPSHPLVPAWEGRLPRELAAAGVTPDEVDLVVLTHLHVDHVGWTMVDGEPFFPAARYVAHAHDYRWITIADAEEPYVREKLVPLRESGRLELVEDSTELLPRVVIRRTGGHTPGHCVVDVGDATLLGDLAVHELQLADPDLPFVEDESSVAAAEQRRLLVSSFSKPPRLVGLAHLGLGLIWPTAQGFSWQPATL